MATKERMTYEERLERCFDRARAERLAVVEVQPNLYAVPSRVEMPGDWRYLRLDGGNILCNCPAAEHHHPCTHLASVVLARAGQLPIRKMPQAQRAAPVPACRQCGQPAPQSRGGYCPDCETAIYYPGSL